MSLSPDVTGRTLPAAHPELPGLDNPRLLPVLPLVYLAWSDGELSSSEVDMIRGRVEALDWLTAECRREVRHWLRPEAPPSARDLQRLLATIRHHAKKLPGRAHQSLAELGMDLARARAAESTDFTDAAGREALHQIEAALGFIGREPVKVLLREDAVGPADEAPAALESTFDVGALQALLDEPEREVREAVRAMLREPAFRTDYGLDKTAHRERVLEWCRETARRGLGGLSYPAAAGGAADPGAFIAAFETLAFFDLSLTVKFGVQFGLFGGSILNLGTERHHRQYLPRVASLELPGCFAMTETGHGSNVRELETVALYDRERQEFVVHTPTERARKDYIGNALHGQMATVFAQLVVDGEGHGVHAFLVPIRDPDGTLCAGVRVEDCGHKIGLNGVDNGRLWFDGVRIPRDNLLDRFGQVSQDGVYTSPISSAGKRFFTMLGTLVGGRVAVAAASVSAAKTALTVAVRYAERRRQFGPAGSPEWALLDYRAHQRRLMPRLARTVALHVATRELTRQYLESEDTERRSVEALAAGVKAYASWATTDTVQVARECCGGRGYLSVNRFGEVRADTDVFTTFEGDNTVLLQLAAKGRLTEFKHSVSDLSLFGTVRFLAEQAARAVVERNPVVTRRSDEAHLRDPDFQLGLLRAREDELVVTAARRIKRRLDEGRDPYEAFNDVQNHLLALATASVERFVAEQLRATIDSVEAPLADVLRDLGDLYVLWCLERQRGWLLEEGYIEGGKAKAIRKLVTRLCSDVRPRALDIVDAFGIPDEVLAAPIGRPPGA